MLDTSKLGPKQKEWVEALLSGKYKQGRGRLFNGTCTIQQGMAVPFTTPKEQWSYCCLGVACEINEERENNLYLTSTMKTYSLLGFKSSAGDYIDEKGENSSLAYDNDDRKHTFSQIAETVCKYADQLFTGPM